ncbi:hypothetical protein, partial [Klebsiella pneumoniae]|uniref:hypothetical protein n=1 Tax=Klebsiella pneumoniae TaxID=573 RepID=UPI0020A62C28
DTDAVYVGASVLSGNEVREKIAGDPDSPYHSLDLNDDLEIEDCCGQVFLDTPIRW